MNLLTMVTEALSICLYNNQALKKLKKNYYLKILILESLMKNKKVTIIDSHVNNLGNIVNACKFLKAEVKVTSDIKEIKKSDKIILPGLGTFNYAMDILAKKKFS